jgi:hypothetical protein
MNGLMKCVRLRGEICTPPLQATQDKVYNAKHGFLFFNKLPPLAWPKLSQVAAAIPLNPELRPQGNLHFACQSLTSKDLAHILV